ncbi:hypothetical protein [Konateibacter massiliensis]|uniref:hypothetical protein n=1 Tax=Konateibacter massiliensis TaxID=2002841 RepID=UPI000C145E33|nr:hypothetical protein [Konateibacter massiliensis]
MRTENVKVTFEIPCHFDEPDCNGDIYTRESWEEAVKKAVGLPIEIINDDGSSTVVGVIREFELIDDGENSYIKAVGSLWHGGTSESVIFTRNKITSVELCGVGITK